MSPFQRIAADRGGIAAGRDVHVGLTPDAVQEMITAALAGQQDARIEDLAGRLGATEQIVHRSLAVLAPHVGNDIAAEALPETIARLIEERATILHEQRALLDSETDPHIRPLRERLVAAQRDGNDVLADTLLAEIADQHRQRRMARAGMQAQLAAAIRADAIAEAQSYASRAMLARASLDYRKAADLLAEAADLTAFDPETSWRHRLTKANVLQDLGREFGDNAALVEAIAAYGQALTQAPHDSRPDDWAMTQNNLGNALGTLGERESGTASLERAVQAYEQALLERTRERVPLDWAATQNNLGAALQALGGRESGTASLERAVQAYEQALLELTRELVPLGWAATQNNLGNALRALGERESDTASLERAVQAFELALLERTREIVPLYWATTQNNLGTALATLGGRESGTASLERAVAAYELALLERTRERVPLDWAMIQNNLGAALATLGARESGTATLERAIQAYEQALLERTRELAPYLWALTQENVAIDRLELGRRRGDAGELRATLAAVDGALEEYRAGKAEYDIEKAERLRAKIVAALGEPDGGKKAPGAKPSPSGL